MDVEVIKAIGEHIVFPVLMVWVIVVFIRS